MSPVLDIDALLPFGSTLASHRQHAEPAEFVGNAPDMEKRGEAFTRPGTDGMMATLPESAR